MVTTYTAWLDNFLVLSASVFGLHEMSQHMPRIQQCDHVTGAFISASIG